MQDRSNALTENTYVRVYGKFKVNPESGASNQLGYINAFAMRPVEDHNEVRFEVSFG